MGTDWDIIERDSAEGREVGSVENVLIDQSFVRARIDLKDQMFVVLSCYGPDESGFVCL